MSVTPIFGITQWEEGQALPESVGNEAVAILEGFAAFTVVEDRDINPPHLSPVDGWRIHIGTAPTGEWAGHDGQIAFRINGAWEYITPFEGLAMWVKDEDALLIYDGSAWNPPALGSALLALAADVWAGTSTTKAITPDALQDAAAPTALTSATTITPNMNAGANFTLTLAHNATLANPSNIQAGDSGVIVITQDGTGSRTMAYGSNWKFPGGAPVLSTAAGAVDALVYYAPTTSLILANLTKGYSS